MRIGEICHVIAVWAAARAIAFVMFSGMAVLALFAPETVIDHALDALDASYGRSRQRNKSEPEALVKAQDRVRELEALLKDCADMNKFPRPS